MSFLTVGSVAVDTIETAADRKERIIGGSASYSAAAAVHFTRPMMVGVVGDDYPMEWLDHLSRRGVDVSGVRQVEGRSFFWHGRYGPDFLTRTSLATELGVFESFKPDLPDHYRSAPFIFLANIKPSLQRMVLDQAASPLLVAMDTMNCWIEGMCDEVLDIIGRVDCLLINDEELEMLTGTATAFHGLRRIREMGARTVIVKLGKWGSILYFEDTFFWTPAYPVERVVDPTGAGDSFAGAFMGCLAAYGHATPRDYRRAMLYASAVASFAVESFEPRALLDLRPNEIAERFMFLRNLINY
jgi:sugar/nucleoside kinase (ribokinase family)